MDAQPSQRYVSVDALRGFDMFWITGGSALVTAAAGVFGEQVREPVARQMEHVVWEGFQFLDLIFPLFVFLAGMSTVFSLGKIVEQRGPWAAWRRLLRRCILIYLLGLFYYDGLAGGFDQIRYVGVLQRIAISSLFAGACFIHLGKRGLLTVLVSILVGYYILLAFIPIPGESEVAFTVDKNWAVWIDQHYLPGRRWNGHWDPEGLLSGIPAVASCLLGVFAGLAMKDANLSPRSRLNRFLLWGGLCLGLGALWSLHLPIIKVVWTSSYVLWAGGLSFLLLALFYAIVDMLHFQFWARPFIWIGMNAITIYMADCIIDFNELAQRLVGGDVAARLGEPYNALLLHAVQMALVLALARFLYRRKLFLRM
jgi:predicted acyltransferase